MLPRVLCAVVSLVVAAAPSQVPARKPAIGRVMLGATPLGGATVTMIGLPPWFDPRFDTADVVNATTDDRGRFRVPLLPGLPYLGVAVGPATVDGAMARSELQGWFGAGALVDFACESPTGPWSVRLRGGEAWAAAGPLQLVALPRLASHMPLPLAVPMVPDEGGALRWPSLPAGILEWRTAAGWPLVAMPLPQTNACELSPPPAVTFPVRVVDDAGAPIANAEIRWRGQAGGDELVDGIATMRWRSEHFVARTDAAGAAELVLPIEDPLALGAATHAMFVARAAGHEERIGGFQGQVWYRDDTRMLPDGDRTLRFQLPRREAIAGAVTREGKPVAIARAVRLAAVAKLKTSPTAYLHDARQFAAALAADGTFTVDGLPADPRETRLLVWTDGVSVPLALPAAPGRPVQLPVDLAAIATLHLQIQDVQRGPAAGLAIYLEEMPPAGAVPAARGASSAPIRLRCCTDGAGRVELRLWPGRWFVAAFGTGGRACSIVGVGPGTDTAMTVAMTPYPMMSGRLFDGANNAVAGAAVQVFTVSKESTATDEADVMARSYVVELLPRMLRRLRTGADGAFELPCPPIPGVKLEIALQSEGRSTERVPLEPRDAPIRMALR